MTISIPDAFWDKYYEACDFFLDNDHIGKSCTLVYPPKKTECSNCTFNNLGGTSTNVYRHGGPAPFNFGRCPMCGGNGYKETEVTAQINLRVYWRNRDWIKVANINVPDAEVQIIGYLADLQKVRQAIEIRLVDERTQGDWRMNLAGEPFPHGFGKNKYFIAHLKRA
jgi:hypothetical protein